MASVSLSVDAANEAVVVTWLDDKGDVTAAPDGVTVNFSSSDDTVLSVDAAGALTLSKAGSATITAAPVDDAGNPVGDFAAESVDVTLTPGAATGFDINVAP